MKKHDDNPDESIKINIIGTCNVVLSCLNINTKLIYISTDYVYPGVNGNYKETDGLSPYSIKNDGISKYGWSKLGGECAVRFLKNYLIIRACLCDYPFPHKAGLTDIKKSLIYTKDAAPLILKLLNQTGVINLGGNSRSVYDFAIKTDSKILPIKKSDIKDVDIAPDTSMTVSYTHLMLPTTYHV